MVGLKENQVYNAATTKVEHRDNALFVAFAPFEAPKAVVALVLENAGGGSAMGAPVARHMLDAYLLPPEPQLPPPPASHPPKARIRARPFPMSNSARLQGILPPQAIHAARGLLPS